MARDAARMRGAGPVVFAQVVRGVAVDAIVRHVLHALQHATGASHRWRTAGRASLATLERERAGAMVGFSAP